MSDSDDDWNAYGAVPCFRGGAVEDRGDESEEVDDWNLPTTAGTSATAASSLDGTTAASSDGTTPASSSVAIGVHLHGEQGGSMSNFTWPSRQKLENGFKVISDTVQHYAQGARHMSGVNRSRVIGTSRPNVTKRLRAGAYFTYNALRKMSSDIIMSAVKRTRQSSPEEPDRGTAVVYMRRRKYDEAQQETVADVPDVQGVTPYSISLLDGRGHVDQVKAKHKLLIAELAWAVILRKTTPPSVRYLTLMGKVPAQIQSFDRNNGETMNSTMFVQCLPCDPYVRKEVERVVEIHAHDEGAPNMRMEKYKAATALPHETDVELLCLAHKKVQVSGEGNKVQKPVDSRLIRLQLSVTGPMTKFMFAAARQVLQDRLTIVPPETVTVADEKFMKEALDLCIPKVEGYDVYRRFIIETLFYGRWGLHDKIRIVDRRKMGFQRLLGLLCSLGLRVLFPRRSWPLLMRSNWTGADVSVDSVLLGTLCFGIFPAAYIGAVTLARLKAGIPLLRYPSRATA